MVDIKDIDIAEVLGKFADDSFKEQFPPEWKHWHTVRLAPGMPMVLAGADGTGKTMFAENIAWWWAKQGKHVTFVHLELSTEVMIVRTMARVWGIEIREIENSHVSRRDIEIALSTIKSLPGTIYLLYKPMATWDDIVKDIPADTDLVIIDYIQKLPQNHVVAVNEIKAWSEQRQVPSIILSQMNKKAKTKGYQKGAIKSRVDIRGRGEITEFVNVVAMIYRSGYNMVDIVIDKNTLGPTGQFSQHVDYSTLSVLHTIEQSDNNDDDVSRRPRAYAIPVKRRPIPWVD